MSLENARKFLDKMKTDSVFQKTVGMAKTKEERMKIVKEAGFDFTLEDLEKAKKELPSDLLDAVSAGHCSIDFACGASGLFQAKG